MRGVEYQRGSHFRAFRRRLRGFHGQVWTIAIRGQDYDEVFLLQEQKSQTFIKSTAILAAASIFVKIIGAVYKIPIYNILDNTGIGAFQVTYNVYLLILSIATAGVPVALSRMVSSAIAVGNADLAKRYFSVALRAFSVVGIVAMIAMLFFSNQLAEAMNNSMASVGIQVLAPAVFCVCIISVYRGYAQGYENMIPTAASQAVEVVGKAVFGIAIAFLLSRSAYAVEHVSAGAILGVTIGLVICTPLLMLFKRKIDRSINPGAHAAVLPSKMNVFVHIMKVSIPITIGASFLAIITVVESSIVLGRLQDVLGYTEAEASALYGVYGKGLTLYNLPPALIVPVGVSIVPAIAAALARGQKKEAGSVMQSSIKLVNLFAMPAGAGLMVLSSPIMIALFNEEQRLAANILMILGVASFLLCLQLVTTAILQANGNERLALLAIPIGGVVKIALVYVLSAVPSIGILGSAISSLICFFVIYAINTAFIMKKVSERPKFAGVFLKPFICTAAMAAVAYFVFELAFRICDGAFGSVRFANIVCLGVAIALSLAVYAVLIIVTRTITMADMKLVPKGEKLAKLLRIRQ